MPTNAVTGSGGPIPPEDHAKEETALKRIAGTPRSAVLASKAAESRDLTSELQAKLAALGYADIRIERLPAPNGGDESYKFTPGTGMELATVRKALIRLGVSEGQMHERKLPALYRDGNLDGKPLYIDPESEGVRQTEIADNHTDSIRVSSRVLALKLARTTETPTP